MKYYDLSTEEEKLLKSFEEGDFVSVKDSKKQKDLYQQYATATLLKTKSINIRLSEKDILKLKARAAEKGIPYQTLVTSILHQYGNS